MLSDAHISAMTILRPVVKDQKVGGGPIPENLYPFPKIVEIILSLAYDITQPIKTNHGHIAGPLTIWDGPHSVCVCVCVCVWSVFVFK